MTIFQFSFGDGYAGSSKVALVSSRLLMNTGHIVHLFVSENSLTEKRATEDNLIVHSINSNQKLNEILKKILPVFSAEHPAVVISHHSLDRKIGIELKRQFKKSFINIGYRHNISKTVPIIGPFIYNRYYDYLIACSQGVADSLTSSGIKENKVKVIRNSITLPENLSAISGEKIRESLSLKDKIVLGMSTWFHKERKGFDILFEAIKELDDKFILLLIGIPESDKSKVIDFASSFNIPKEKLIMPGYVENVWEYYNAMDIFLLTSRSEGFSLALLEAGAARLPIIASNIPGNNEFIVDKRNGVLFDINKPDQLKDAILKLSEDKFLAGEFAAKAYNDVMENYLLKNYSDALLNFLAAVTHK
ncbi:MAG: glycosyltransferase family 4 protein [Ignavibacteriales bacterium]|nr:MAG: glycosyltransferase family 4 protein [Ignavibacteriales bacterium]